MPGTPKGEKELEARGPPLSALNSAYILKELATKTLQMNYVNKNYLFQIGT